MEWVFFPLIIYFGFVVGLEVKANQNDLIAKRFPKNLPCPKVPSGLFCAWEINGNLASSIVEYYKELHSAHQCENGYYTLIHKCKKNEICETEGSDRVCRKGLKGETNSETISNGPCPGNLDGEICAWELIHLLSVEKSGLKSDLLEKPNDIFQCKNGSATKISSCDKGTCAAVSSRRLCELKGEKARETSSNEATTVSLPSTTKKPHAKKSTTKKPSTKKPTTRKPTTKEPHTKKSTTKKPTTSNHTTTKYKSKSISPNGFKDKKKVKELNVKTLPNRSCPKTAQGMRCAWEFNMELAMRKILGAAYFESPHEIWRCEGETATWVSDCEKSECLVDSALLDKRICRSVITEKSYTTEMTPSSFFGEISTVNLNEASTTELIYTITEESQKPSTEVPQRPSTISDVKVTEAPQPTFMKQFPRSLSNPFLETYEKSELKNIHPLNKAVKEDTQEGCNERIQAMKPVPAEPGRPQVIEVFDIRINRGNDCQKSKTESTPTTNDSPVKGKNVTADNGYKSNLSAASTNPQFLAEDAINSNLEGTLSKANTTTELSKENSTGGTSNTNSTIPSAVNKTANNVETYEISEYRYFLNLNFVPVFYDNAYNLGESTQTINASDSKANETVTLGKDSSKAKANGDSEVNTKKHKQYFEDDYPIEFSKFLASQTNTVSGDLKNSSGIQENASSLEGEGTATESPHPEEHITKAPRYEETEDNYEFHSRMNQQLTIIPGTEGNSSLPSKINLTIAGEGSNGTNVSDFAANLTIMEESANTVAIRSNGSNVDSKESSAINSAKPEQHFDDDYPTEFSKLSAVQSNALSGDWKNSSGIQESSLIATESTTEAPHSTENITKAPRYEETEDNYEFNSRMTQQLTIIPGADGNFSGPANLTNLGKDIDEITPEKVNKSSSVDLDANKGYETNTTTHKQYFEDVYPTEFSKLLTLQSNKLSGDTKNLAEIQGISLLENESTTESPHFTKKTTKAPRYEETEDNYEFNSRLNQQMTIIPGTSSNVSGPAKLPDLPNDGDEIVLSKANQSQRTEEDDTYEESRFQTSQRFLLTKGKNENYINDDLIRKNSPPNETKPRDESGNTEKNILNSESLKLTTISQNLNETQVQFTNGNETLSENELLKNDSISNQNEEVNDAKRNLSESQGSTKSRQNVSEIIKTDTNEEEDYTQVKTFVKESQSNKTNQFEEKYSTRIQTEFDDEIQDLNASSLFEAVDTNNKSGNANLSSSEIESNKMNASLEVNQFDSPENFEPKEINSTIHESNETPSEKELTIQISGIQGNPKGDDETLPTLSTNELTKVVNQSEETSERTLKVSDRQLKLEDKPGELAKGSSVTLEENFVKTSDINETKNLNDYYSDHLEVSTNKPEKSEVITEDLKSQIPPVDSNNPEFSNNEPEKSETTSASVNKPSDMKSNGRRIPFSRNTQDSNLGKQELTDVEESRDEEEDYDVYDLKSENITRTHTKKIPVKISPQKNNLNLSQKNNTSQAEELVTSKSSNLEESKSANNEVQFNNDNVTIKNIEELVDEEHANFETDSHTHKTSELLSNKNITQENSFDAKINQTKLDALNDTNILNGKIETTGINEGKSKFQTENTDDKFDQINMASKFNTLKENSRNKGTENNNDGSLHDSQEVNLSKEAQYGEVAPNDFSGNKKPSDEHKDVKNTQERDITFNKIDKKASENIKSENTADYDLKEDESSESLYGVTSNDTVDSMNNHVKLFNSTSRDRMNKWREGEGRKSQNFINVDEFGNLQRNQTNFHVKSRNESDNLDSNTKNRAIFQNNNRDRSVKEETQRVKVSFTRSNTQSQTESKSEKRFGMPAISRTFRNALSTFSTTLKPLGSSSSPDKKYKKVKK